MNPAHLWLGTHLDNMRDCSRKKRYYLQRHPERRPRALASQFARGERIPWARLTEDRVRWIRQQIALGRPASDLAKEIGVCASAVRRAASGKTWRHVDALLLSPGAPQEGK